MSTEAVFIYARDRSFLVLMHVDYAIHVMPCHFCAGTEATICSSRRNDTLNIDISKSHLPSTSTFQSHFSSFFFSTPIPVLVPVPKSNNDVHVLSPQIVVASRGTLRPADLMFGLFLTSAPGDQLHFSFARKEV
jgi:hypothetical protein